MVEPKPLQRPHPPLWFGTRGESMLRLLARYGDGWIPIRVSPVEYARKVSRIEAWAAERGRAGRLTYIYDANPSTGVRKIVGEGEAYGRAGCHFYSMLWEYPREEFVERIRWFSKNVVSRFS